MISVLPSIKGGATFDNYCSVILCINTLCCWYSLSHLSYFSSYFCGCFLLICFMIFFLHSSFFNVPLNFVLGSLLPKKGLYIFPGQAHPFLWVINPDLCAWISNTYLLFFSFCFWSPGVPRSQHIHVRTCYISFPHFTTKTVLSSVTSQEWLSTFRWFSKQTKRLVIILPFSSQFSWIQLE